jgi:hypothetical protein
MFYDAMLTSGVEQARALVMYGAVYRHGPRWPDPPGMPEAQARHPERPTKLLRKMSRMERRKRKVSTPEQVEALPPTIAPHRPEMGCQFRSEK